MCAPREVRKHCRVSLVYLFSSAMPSLILTHLLPYPSFLPTHSLTSLLRIYSFRYIDLPLVRPPTRVHKHRRVSSNVLRINSRASPSSSVVPAFTSSIHSCVCTHFLICIACVLVLLSCAHPVKFANTVM